MAAATTLTRAELVAVAIANNSTYGLSGAVFTTDLQRSLQVAERITTGTARRPCSRWASC